MKLKIIFSFLFITVMFLIGCSKEGDYDSFAKCLTEKGATMYGTEWCSHCKSQKELFGNSFQYINYIDCDLKKGECDEAEIEGYPTWVIDGEKYPGENQIFELAGLAKCNIN